MDENELVEKMRRTLPNRYRDAFDKFVMQYRDLVASEYQDTIDAILLDVASPEIEEALRKVHDWFFDVFELHKPMSDPRKIYKMVERALRP